MSDANIPRSTILTNTASVGASAVEHQLRTLQDTHRLAIHMVERDNHAFSYDTATIADLNKIPAEQIASNLAQGGRSEFSMSLIPSTAAKIGMAPYNVKPSQFNNFGYLFDLSSQNTAHPPRVLRADDKTLESGNNREAKIVNYLNGSYIDTLDALYRNHSQVSPQHNKEAEASYIRSLGSDDGIKLTAMQLDALGNWYVKVFGARPDSEQSKPSIQHIDHSRPRSLINWLRAGARTLSGSSIGRPTLKSIVPYNEIIVAASTPHIAAIVIPSYENEPAALRLQAALVGLDHLRHGAYWPVVTYKVDGTEKGKICYLAQGREELLALGLSALQELGELSLRNLRLSFDREEHRQAFDEALMREFNVDLKQHHANPYVLGLHIERAISTLRAQISSPAPERQLHQTSPASAGR